jgi:hypothetical protein
LVEIFHGLNGFGHQVIRFLDDSIPLSELFPGEELPVTGFADFNHFLSEFSPFLGFDLNDSFHLKFVQESRWMAVSVDEAQPLENRLSVSNPLHILFGKAQGQEAPGGFDAVIPPGKMAGLARRTPLFLGIHSVDDAML